MTGKSKPKTCSAPGCNQPPLFKVEDDNWLCRRHISERVHSPEAMVITEAGDDMRTFRDEGGKLS